MSKTLLFLTAAAIAQSGGGGPVADPNAPLSSVVAINVVPGFSDLPSFVRRQVGFEVAGTLPPEAFFPLANDTTDTVRSVRGTNVDLVVKWLDPIDGTNDADSLRFGSNCDYMTFFGDGWNSDWVNDQVGSPPYGNGAGDAGWLWVNHEYISNSVPTLTSAPTGQSLTLADLLSQLGTLTNDVTSNVWEQEDVNVFDRQHKKNLGGAWVRITRDANGDWTVDEAAQNIRYDSTSNTQVRVTGLPIGPTSDFRDHMDDGEDNDPMVVSGIQADCSGATTPWGTVITAEENVQGYYGDFEPTWSSGQRFNVGNGFDPGSNVNPPFQASRSARFGRMSTVQDRHTRDLYGFLVEIDPGVDPNDDYVGLSEGGDGAGHRKLGAVGRARWENATFAVGTDGRLVDGQPIVMYAGNDRRGGRVWKFVTDAVYTDGMTKAQVRDMLDAGTLYVAHFADLENSDGQTLAGSGGVQADESNRGTGRWIEFSVDSLDSPPNAGALGQPTITVGEALLDVDYNAIGGFPSDDIAKKCLFTAATKLGVRETNRPEDVEYNANDFSGMPRIYIAFTNHTRQVALDQDGVLFDPASHSTDSPNRGDVAGSVMVVEEGNAFNPGASSTFTFWTAYRGQLSTDVGAAAAPDNIAIDSSGGVWFGTDGNFSRNGTADAVYYLDMDPAHRAGEPGVVNATFGQAFRIAAVPSDAEATGPAFSGDESTLFIAVQHPGESNPSTWPQDR